MWKHKHRSKHMSKKHEKWQDNSIKSTFNHRFISLLKVQAPTECIKYGICDYFLISLMTCCLYSISIHTDKADITRIYPFITNSHHPT